MQKLTHMRQDFWVSFVKKKICIFFSKKIGYSFHKVLENVTISVFPYFFASYPLLHSLFVFVCCITSYVKRLQQNIPCPNQNIDKNLEKLQFWPRDAGTLRSQKICNSGILFEFKIE